MRTLKRIGFVLLLLPAAGGADEVHLQGGGVVSGVIVERTDDAIALETGPGRVTVPRSRIVRIAEGRSTLAAFRERSAGIDPADVESLAHLARWAEAHDLATQARETWARVLAADPGHPEANAALGRVNVDGVWMDEGEAYRARGYVLYRGRWVTPAEHEALALKRAEQERAARDLREADLRVREAEARAREAEARAREAETLADQAENQAEGIPYWWVLSGGGPVWPPGGFYPRPPLVLPEPPMARSPLAPPRVEPRPRGSSTGRVRGASSKRPARGGLSPAPPQAGEPKGTIGSGSSRGRGPRH